MQDYINTSTQVGRLDVTGLRGYQGLCYPAPDGSPRPFDLYLPDEGEGPYPLIISVSGGGWYFGHPTSQHLGKTIHSAVKRGYAIASLACTSSAEQIFPYQIREIRCALQYLRKNAARWQLDPDWVAYWSSSSGGHLSLMAALTVDEAAFDCPLPELAGQSAAVQAMVAIYPICQLGAKDADFGALGLKSAFDRTGERCMDSLFLGCPVEYNEALRDYASPMFHITPSAPPLLLMHGAADVVVPYPYSQRFVEKYQEIAGADAARFLLLPGAGHSDPRFKDEAMCGRILDFLDEIRLGRMNKTMPGT